jgi:NitT/TauT family transport system substrate-binding protein
MGTSRMAQFTALIAAGALALAACGGSGDSSSSGSSGSGGTLRVALNNTTDSLAVIVAEKQGFFAKHNVSVKTTTLNDITLVPGLLGKQYDIGFTVAPILIRAKASGLPVVMIAGNNGDSATDQPVQIYVRKGITNVKQLAGKRIGSPTLTGNINIATKAWLSANGVDPAAENFVQVPTPNMVDQLKAGQVDAVEVIYPFINLAKQSGLTTLGDPERALSNSYVGGTYWSASQSWASKNPTAVSNFRAALQDADKWIAANSDAAYQAAADYTKVSVTQAKASPLGQYTTEVSAADLKIWGDAMKKFGGFNGNIDYAGLVDTGK